MRLSFEQRSATFRLTYLLMILKFLMFVLFLDIRLSRQRKMLGGRLHWIGLSPHLATSQEMSESSRYVLT